MIRLNHVSKSFGPFLAVRDVSLEVLRGQCVGILGPNGAGKTTTLRMVTGFLPPSAGTVDVGGHDTIAESLAARRLIGYLPEATPLYPEMRVEDFLTYRARLYGLGGAARRAAVGRTLELCRLREVVRRRIAHLSKGYRQRVGLGGALVHDPPVLVLDEPTSGLDPSQIRETRSLIRDLAAHRTVVVSSHILPEIEKTCDRVIIFARGQVRADGSPEALVRGEESERYMLEAADGRGIGEMLTKRLRALVGVETVASAPAGEEWKRLVVTARAGAGDLREAIGREAAACGATVRELSRAAPTLEQVFMRVIDADETADGSTARTMPTAPAPAEAAAA